MVAREIAKDMSGAANETLGQALARVSESAYIIDAIAVGPVLQAVRNPGS